MSQKKLTQGQVAEHLGVARAMISKIVNGRASLPPAWTEDLDKLLGRGWLMSP